MPTYLVTGATGFLGRRLTELLLARHTEADPVRVLALTREGSVGKLAVLAADMPGGEHVEPLVGDLTARRLGLSEERIAQLVGSVDHVVHLAAVYDMTAPAAVTERANVDGTRAVVELANALGARHLHHVSSIAVGGDYPGVFTEDMFDVGQPLTSPYHRTKFEAERIVRDEASVPWRVYRPSAVVGDSRTGEMDKVDGPYYVFALLARMRMLPPMPWVLPDVGDTNIVPVDYVVAAMAYLMHEPDLDGRAFHLGHPRPQPVVGMLAAFCRAAGVPAPMTLDKRISAPVMGLAALAERVPGVGYARDLVAGSVGIPPEVLPHLSFVLTFDTAATRKALRHSGLATPDIDRYAQRLWDYWAAHLDPDRARRRQAAGPSPLAGRTIVITGASSGIGRSTALMVAQRGGIPILVARSTDKLEELREEIEAGGGEAYVYSCDVTQGESVDALVKQLVADHPGGIDMLVNNAGRSIRRSVKLSYDRFHDYERTMALNYFGAIRLILGLLPHMSERKFGHIVNVSSIGVQTNPPRFSAYVASKAALDAFSRVVASETWGDHVTFTTIHMPLVRTPMIAPTKIYDAFPTISPDQAAAMIVRALEKKPKHVGTTLGTIGEVSYALVPKAVDAVLHQAYRLFPDSTAARTGPDGTDATAGGKSGVPSPPAILSQSAITMAKVFRGVHW
jgi:NAD(P)-dependent dehydrogenase (short-subunit alcohol dehydrogenase family)